MAVKVDADLCSGCGLCVDTCPDVFEMGEGGTASVKNAEASADAVQDAVDGCPSGAISL